MIVPGQVLVRLRFSESIASLKVPRGRLRRKRLRKPRVDWNEFDRLLESIRARSVSRVHEPIPLWQLKHARWSQSKRRLDSTFLIRYDAEGVDLVRALANFREWKRVVSVEPNRFVIAQNLPGGLAAPPSRPTWADQIRLQQVWPDGVGDPRVTVAVIDTGVARAHPAFMNCLRIEPGCDVVDVAAVKAPGGAWIGDTTNPDDDPEDDVGHGTHMSGLVSGSGFGVAPSCKILPIRALAGLRLATGEVVAMGKKDDLARAIRFASDRKASILNCSFANAAVDSSGPSFVEEDAIGDAVAAGCFIAAAMGNDGNLDQVKYPAGLDNVCAVSAIDNQGARWMETSTHGSQRGSHCDLCAPGARIDSASLHGGSESRSGTSAATAIVSGAAALVQSYALHHKGHLLPGDELGRLLTGTARRLWSGAEYKRLEFGYGCVDPAAAIDRLKHS